jgi:hypothetical protein
MPTAKIIETKLSDADRLKLFASVVREQRPPIDSKQRAGGSRQVFRIKHGH